MSEVRFEHATGTRRLAGWWVATIGACLMGGGLAGALALPLVTRDASEGSVYFAIGLAAATIGFFAFIAGRNLMLRRIVLPAVDDRDADPLNETDPRE
jgi:hypothetical protein